MSRNNTYVPVVYLCIDWPILGSSSLETNVVSIYSTQNYAQGMKFVYRFVIISLICLINKDLSSRALLRNLPCSR